MYPPKTQKHMVAQDGGYRSHSETSYSRLVSQFQLISWLQILHYVN